MEEEVSSVEDSEQLLQTLRDVKNRRRQGGTYRVCSWKRQFLLGKGLLSRQLIAAFRGLQQWRQTRVHLGCAGYMSAAFTVALVRIQQIGQQQHLEDCS
eukprot:scaffold747_cov120-Cylindrotheca_fusiformis.AAC.3